MPFIRKQDGDNLFASDVNEIQAAIEATVLKTAQANLTGSGSAALVGSVNGTNKAFTVPLGFYSAGSLFIYLNGVLQVPGEAFTETSPATGVFTFQEAPTTGDQIYVMYQQLTVDAVTAGSVNALNIALAVVL